jgi:flagellar hook-associated protein FlgK
MNVYATALTGLQTAQSQLNAAANNIAHFDLSRFNPQKPYQDGVPGGVAVDYIPPTELPPDLATETIALKQSTLLYGANAIVIKTANQMYGNLLNVLDTDNNHFNPDGSAKF